MASKNPTSKSSLVSPTHKNGKTGDDDAIRAENKRLRASIRKLRRERDDYRRAVYAWVEEQFIKDGGLELMKEKSGLPLAQFLPQLKKEIYGE